MDALDEAIATKQREVGEARDRLARLEMELATLERAAELRPASEVGRRVAGRPEQYVNARRRGGRQPGAISKKWRAILHHVATHFPEGGTPDDIASFGPGIGLKNLKPKDARQQAEKYVELGFLEAADGRFKVTDLARKRFLETSLPSSAAQDALSLPKPNGQIHEGPSA